MKRLKIDDSDFTGSSSSRSHGTEGKILDSELLKSFKVWKQDASKMTYQESITELEKLISDLQNDQISIEEIQSSYLRAKIYFDRCESLLNNIEQEVVDLDLEKLFDNKND